MKRIPKITVIIPCLNAKNTIQKTFDSLKKQNYPNLECIVVDGGSTDGTNEILENYKELINICISEKDTGAPDAQNKGIKKATGDIIGYLHSDDYYEDNMLDEISKAYIENSKFDIFTYGMEIEKLSDSKVIMSSCSKKNLTLNLNNILFKHAMGHFYKRTLFQECGYLKTHSSKNSVMYANDREHLIRLCLLGKKNYVVDKVLYRMRSHSNSNTLSRKNIVLIRYEHLEIAENFIKEYSDSLYKFNKLIDFKAHNLSLLFTYFMLTLSVKKASQTFLIGCKFKGYKWILIIITAPLRELCYRATVKKWF